MIYPKTYRTCMSICVGARLCEDNVCVALAGQRALGGADDPLQIAADVVRHTITIECQDIDARLDAILRVASSNPLAHLPQLVIAKVLNRLVKAEKGRRGKWILLPMPWLAKLTAGTLVPVGQCHSAASQCLIQVEMGLSLRSR